jgi:hypothetical protein
LTFWENLNSLSVIWINDSTHMDRMYTIKLTFTSRKFHSALAKTSLSTELQRHIYVSFMIPYPFFILSSLDTLPFPLLCSDWPSTFWLWNQIVTSFFIIPKKKNYDMHTMIPMIWISSRKLWQLTSSSTIYYLKKYD